MISTFDDLKPYVGYICTDDLNCRMIEPNDVIPDTAAIVGWQCGFEPMCVAVWSYLDKPGDTLPFDLDEAVEIASDWLLEIKWLEDDTAPDHAVNKEVKS